MIVREKRYITVWLRLAIRKCKTLAHGREWLRLAHGRKYLITI